MNSMKVTWVNWLTSMFPLESDLSNDLMSFIKKIVLEKKHILNQRKKIFSATYVANAMLTQQH